jgi:pimeloyl-ACP methyl ester carboxylesterase
MNERSTSAAIARVAGKQRRKRKELGAMTTKSGYFQGTGGVKLYYEETGSGVPIVFCHEFAGDIRSWEPQVRFFSHRFRVITYNARGYPPSDVPTDSAAYSMDNAVADVVALLDHLKIEKAHVVGFSMGSFTSLFFGMRHPDRARSVTPVCCGYGAEKGWDEIHNATSTPSPTHCRTTPKRMQPPTATRAARPASNSCSRTRGGGRNSPNNSETCRALDGP